MRHRILLGLLALVGCYPYIGGNKFEEQRCLLDEDGDGNLKCSHEVDGETIEGDCDDFNPAINNLPTTEEIPYDGWDNDCEGGDVIDADGDFFPGISREEYAALDREPWQEGLENEVDCNDQNEDINPDADELFYDGVDQDCDGACDYDADGDGFADQREGQDNDCGIPATDCLDTRSGNGRNVFPGAEGEEPYDGEDTDCDGTNDFDPDGDGWIWADYQADYEEYLQVYGYPDDSQGYGECYDLLDDDLPSASPADPASVNPAATEVWRNGVDNDCSDIDGMIEVDFDQDGDGFLPTASRSAFLAYVQDYVDFTRADGARPFEDAFKARFGDTSADWAAWFDARDNDCDDEDATIFPGTLEVLGDAVDQDCDGGVDTSPFIPIPLVWDELGQVRTSTTDDHFVLVFAGLGDSVGGTSPGLAARSLDLDARPSSTPNTDGSLLTGTESAIAPGVGLWALDAGYYVAGGRTVGTSTRTAVVQARPPTGGTANYARANALDGASISGVLAYTGAEALCEVGANCWALTCGDGQTQFVEFTDGSGTGFRAVQTADQADSAIDCFIADTGSGSALLALVDSSGNVDAYTGSGGAFVAQGSHPFTGDTLAHASNHDDLVILGRAGTGVEIWSAPSSRQTVLSAVDTVQADAVIANGRTYAVGVESGGNRLWLSYEDAGGTVNEGTVPVILDGEALTVRTAGLGVSAERILLTVVATDAAGDDHLLWVPFEI